MEGPISQFRSYVSQYKLPIIIGLAGLAFLFYGLITTMKPFEASEQIQFVSSDHDTISDTPLPSAKKDMIVIDIAGAVNEPGVYKMPGDARIKDALEAAKGMNEQADSEAVAKRINLAAKLIDGMKVYIPFLGEEQVQSAAGEIGDELININAASQKDLESLVGVGEVTAQKIIDNRPYERIEDLETKDIVSPAVFNKIKDGISIY